jgi:uncharacterized protein
MRTKAIFAAMLLVLAPLPSVAQDFMAGLWAFTERDYATALRNWKPLAEQGEVEAQDNLGLMYEEGYGVLQDYAEAVRWYRLAGSSNNLGRMYEQGHGVAQSYVKAHMWYNIAAEKYPPLAPESRQRLANLMTTADISEAQRRARVCVESNYQDCD